jgi:NADH-quinone oxidoreductase subunit H
MKFVSDFFTLIFSDFIGIDSLPFVVNLLTTLVIMVVIILSLVISVSFLVYFERKIIAATQMRIGPNVVGPFGLLQTFADAFKSLTKETIIPYRANKLLFLTAPVITFTTAFGVWVVIPVDYKLVLQEVNIATLYILALSSLGVYGVLLAGWSSNSKYAFLGAMRSVSQMISYELVISSAILCVALLSGSLNLSKIVEAQKDLWFVVPLFPIFIMFFIAILAETNRHPFDLPEAEAELVSGYNVEYSSMSFAMFFLGEYASMISMSTFCSLLFLGGWLPLFELEFLHIPGFVWLFIKVAFLLYMFIIARAALPRYRYDQLMSLCWKYLLPLCFVYLVIVATFKVFWV